MKGTIVVLACVMMFSIIGCQQKSATEQLKADAQKAATQVDKEMQGLMK